MKNFFKAIFLFSLPVTAALVTGSCVPQACLEDTEVYANASFYETGTGKAQAPAKITLYGLGMEDEKIYDEAASLSSIKIPLNAGSDTCIFIMKINGVADTVTFFYSSYPHLVTKECGYTYYHSIDSIENTRAGVSFIVKARNVTTANEANINIFY